MDLKTRVSWNFELHDKAVDQLDHLAEICTHCQHYREKEHFNRDERVNFFWGLCPKHLVYIKNLMDEIDALNLALERDLGVYCEGYFRHLPDGRLCTLHTPVWRDYLLSLC